MELILLENYNNYFNRIVKYHNSIEPYIEDRNYAIFSGINFIFNDGVETTQVINMPLDNNFVPDYLLVCDKDGNIQSRWFVLEWILLSGVQYQATLRNDVLANYIDNIKNAPIFVQKAMIRESNNPFIYNSEGMSFNEIKRNEILLKDKTKRGWIVGYYTQKLASEEESKTFKTKYSRIEGSDVATPITEIDPRVNINLSGGGKLTNTNLLEKKIITYVGPGVPYNSEVIINFREATDHREISVYYDDPTITDTIYSWNTGTGFNFEIFRKNLTLFANAKQNELLGKYFNEDFIPDRPSDEYVRSLEGKLVSDENDKLFFIKVQRYQVNKVYKDINYNNTPEDKDYLAYFGELVKTRESLARYYVDDYKPSQYNKNVMRLCNTYTSYIVSLEPADIAEQDIEVTVSKARNHLSDAPYDMFCIPFDINNIDQTEVKLDEETFNINNILSLAMAKGLAMEAGGLGQANTYLYDIQYLPYCPIEELKDDAVMSFDDKGKLILNVKTTLGFKPGKDYSIIKSGAVDKKSVSIIFWATKRSGTFNIDYKKEVPQDPIDFKVMNETEMLRVCSPNYSGIFEFSPTKNKGVDYFNVDYTYRPYNPYIHINPNFKGLYGNDYNDNRGLIVGGDFSLETLTDAFVNYELRNKNYRQMFDREIENMDVNNKIDLESQIISGSINSLTAGMAGGALGGKAGGPMGALAGGIMGLGGSLVGSGLDIHYGQEKYREARGFKTDMFNYNLGNIKALPRSLTKTTAFTYNHKVFPFIEEYDCTDREKQALRDKIKYNSMTVMAIDRLANYLNDSSGDEKNFFKGQVIRLDKIAEDYHVASVIYEELDKGVYL